MFMLLLIESMENKRETKMHQRVARTMDILDSNRESVPFGASTERQK